MKRFEEKTRTTTTTRHEVVEVHCFVCNDLAPRPNDQGDYWDSGGWSKNSYDIDHVILSYTNGHKFPHSGKTANIEEWDCCPSCYQKTIRPFFLSLGQPDAYEVFESERYHKKS